MENTISRGKEMNYKPFVLIALALCLCVSFPASAMWDNGNWVPDDANVGYQVVHNPVSGVDSKYKAIPQTIEDRSPGESMQGILRGSIRCGYNTLTREVGIRNDANPDGVNGTFTFFPILPNGMFGDLDGNQDITLIPGNFTLFLKDGNGGQPEYSHARITANEISYPEVELKGHAISSSVIEIPVVEPTVKICSAFYYPDMHKKPIDGHVKLTWKNHFGIADVTSAVRSRVNGGQTTFEVSNTNLGGDPAYGWYKQLTVVYVTGEGSCRHSCDWKSQTVDEGSLITLH